MYTLYIFFFEETKYHTISNDYSIIVLCSVQARTDYLEITVCPRSSVPFYTVTYIIKWVTTSWTFSASFSCFEIFDS